jgi:hypothetical protein
MASDHLSRTEITGERGNNSAKKSTVAAEPLKGRMF